MAVLTVQEISRAGLEPAYVAVAAGGDSFPNDGRTFIHVKNTNGATRTVTIATQITVDGKAVADDAVVIDATTGDTMIGPFPPDIYNDANGRVNLTYSADTGVTIAVIRRP